jgi:hypothetical protein
MRITTLYGGSLNKVFCHYIKGLQPSTQLELMIERQLGPTFACYPGRLSETKLTTYFIGFLQGRI